MTTHIAGYEIGRWSDELFASYRAAKGPRRAHFLGLLVRVNEPLAKTILDQLRGGEDKKGRHRYFGGCDGFRELQWEDAYQVALIALTRALERFDPRKGRFSSYVKLWMRAELQRYTFGGGDERSLVRVPRGAEGDVVPVALMDDQGELDRLSGGEEDAAIERLEGRGDFDPGDARLVAWDPAQLAGANDLDPRAPMQRFLDDRLSFRRHAREAREPLFASFERFAAHAGIFASHAALRRELEARGAQQQGVRVPWSEQPVAGFRGVELRRAV